MCVNEMINEMNRNNELFGELADDIIQANMVENGKTKLHTGGTHREAILRTLQKMLNPEDFDIDKLLELMVDEGCQRLCEYCITAKFIAVDRRRLIHHLLINHNFEWPEEEGMKSTIVKILAFVFSYEHPNEVFRWMGATLAWSNRAIQCTNCPTVQQLKPKPKKYCGAASFFKHWLGKHPNQLVTCKMCNGSFGYAGSYLSHRCVGASVLCFPQGITIEDNSKDVDLMYYDCEACPPNKHRTFPSFFNYFMHVRQDHNACEGCLKEFPSQSKLKAHVGENSPCASVRPTCWKCEDASSYPNAVTGLPEIYYQSPKTFKSQEDLALHELMAEPHSSTDQLKTRCEFCSISKVWYIYHFCNNVKTRGRPAGSTLVGPGNHFWRRTSDNTFVALARSIEVIDPTSLEGYALDAISEQSKPNNPFIGMEKTDIFHTLQKFAQPLGRAWCLHWWWGASSLQHLLMLTRQVIDPMDLPAEVMNTNTVDVLDRDLEVSDDTDEEKMETEKPSDPFPGPNEEGNSEDDCEHDEEMESSDLFCLCKKYKVGSGMWKCGGGTDCSSALAWFHYECMLPKVTVVHGNDDTLYCDECAQKLT